MITHTQIVQLIRITLRDFPRERKHSIALEALIDFNIMHPSSRLTNMIRWRVRKEDEKTNDKVRMPR